MYRLAGSAAFAVLTLLAACSSTVGGQAATGSADDRPSTNVPVSGGPPTGGAAATGTGTCEPGSGTDYEVGPGATYESINEVPWESLEAGDSVRIAYRPEPYHEKIVISASGTSDAPLVVCGIKGPNGERPIVDGADAEHRPQSAPASSGHSRRSLILVGQRDGQEWGYKPSHIVIAGLDVLHAHPDSTFTAANGQVETYADNAAGIWVERGENVTIRDNVIHENANGLFVSSGDDEATVSRSIMIEANEIYDNGNVGRDREHNIYTEADGITFQYNRIGPVLEGAGGVALKDRSAGTVIRYNFIEGGSRTLDLVEAENAFPIFADLPSYRETFVYGNVLIARRVGPTTIVHYGGDSGETDTYRKGTLYFYNNTVVHEADQEKAGDELSRYYSQVLELTADETAEVRNNILVARPSTPGQTATTLSLMLEEGTADVGPNLVTPGIEMWRGNRESTGRINGWDNLIPLTDNDPGFVDVDSGDLHLVEGAQAIDLAEPLDPAAADHPVDREYLYHQAGRSRPAQGNAPDMGAFEYGLPDEHDAGAAPPTTGPARSALPTTPESAGASAALSGEGPPALDFVPDLGGSGAESPCGGTVRCVGASGGTDTSIQAAVDAVADGGTIQVEAGTYRENVRVVDKGVTLLGGFPSGGGFSGRDPGRNPTVIDGGGIDTVVYFEDYGESADFDLDGFVVTGGVAKADQNGGRAGSGVLVAGGKTVTIANNRIERNGHVESSGGGIGASGNGTVIITGNIIRDNVAGFGAGIGLASPNARIDANLIENNKSHADHGGGLFLSGDGLRVTRNLVRGNEIGVTAGYGWGGGGIYAGTSSSQVASAVFEQNRWVANSAPSIGSGLFIDEAGHADIRGDLFHDNTCGNAGAAIYVDGGGGIGSTATIENVTAAGHDCGPDVAGSGLFVEGGSSVQVRASIFDGNGGSSEVLFCDAPESLPCINEPAGAVNGVQYSIVRGPIKGGSRGAGVIDADPGFVDPAADDYRLRPGSPALVAGDPSLPDDRRYLGAYGPG